MMYNARVWAPPFKVQGILHRYDARVWAPPLKGAGGCLFKGNV